MPRHTSKSHQTLIFAPTNGGGNFQMEEATSGIPSATGSQDNQGFRTSGLAHRTSGVSFCFGRMGCAVHSQKRKLAFFSSLLFRNNSYVPCSDAELLPKQAQATGSVGITPPALHSDLLMGKSGVLLPTSGVLSSKGVEFVLTRCLILTPNRFVSLKAIHISP